MATKIRSSSFSSMTVSPSLSYSLSTYNTDIAVQCIHKGSNSYTSHNHLDKYLRYDKVYCNIGSRLNSKCVCYSISNV